MTLVDVLSVVAFLGLVTVLAFGIAVLYGAPMVPVWIALALCAVAGLTFPRSRA